MPPIVQHLRVPDTTSRRIAALLAELAAAIDKRVRQCQTALLGRHHALESLAPKQ